jgi:hypothetical protein
MMLIIAFVDVAQWLSHHVRERCVTARSEADFS